MTLRAVLAANAQLGRKTGGEQALARLLRVADLPGEGWEELDARTWPTGESDPETGWAQRAQHVHAMTAWRSFEQDGGARWLWLEVTPLVGADARAALARMAPRLVVNCLPHAEVIREEDVAAPAIRDVSYAWAHEQESVGPRSRDQAYLLACVADDSLLALAVNGSAGSWDWAAIVGVAEQQLQRLRATH